jgi:hypothetical protein
LQAAVEATLVGDVEDAVAVADNNPIRQVRLQHRDKYMLKERTRTMMHNS